MPGYLSGGMDCFVATLLAMTVKKTRHCEPKAKQSSGASAGIFLVKDDRWTVFPPVAPRVP
jgi:hypothetical protein